MKKIHGVDSEPTTRSASVLFDISDANTGERHALYRCDECKALLLGGEDAREHLWWHDTLV